MHKRGLCRRAVSVCLSVTFVYCVETGKDTASCCGMRIGNRIHAFEWYHFRRPSVTSKLQFHGHADITR